jgi:hypothetical protein
MPSIRNSQNTSGRSRREDDAAAMVPHGQQSFRAPTSSRPSQMQVALPGRPSQMQVALPGHRYDEPARDGSSRSQAAIGYDSHGVPQLYTLDQQFAVPGNRYLEPPRFNTSVRPSQMQMAMPGERDVQAPAQTHAVLPSIRETPPRSSRPAESYRDPGTRHAPNPQQYQIEPPSRELVRRQTGQTRLVRPGEPHHFGARTDFARGEVICILCRCSNPESHGDAYTMLNSPRGRDIHGRPIDWQEAKKRMLDYHREDQITHAEEVAAIPHVYDEETARIALAGEERLRAGARQGHTIEVNTAGNNVG